MNGFWAVSMARVGFILTIAVLVGVIVHTAPDLDVSEFGSAATLINDLNASPDSSAAAGAGSDHAKHCSGMDTCTVAAQSKASSESLARAEAARTLRSDLLDDNKLRPRLRPPKNSLGQ